MERSVRACPNSGPDYSGGGASIIGWSLTAAASPAARVCELRTGRMRLANSCSFPNAARCAPGAARLHSTESQWPASRVRPRGPSAVVELGDRRRTAAPSAGVASAVRSSRPPCPLRTKSRPPHIEFRAERSPSIAPYFLIAGSDLVVVVVGGCGRNAYAQDNRLLTRCNRLQTA